MVKDTGAAQGTGGVRPLGLPRPIEVRTDHRGWPVAVKLDRRWAPVTVEDRWRIDDEWWREEPVLRAYFLLEGSISLVVFKDLLSSKWSYQPP